MFHIEVMESVSHIDIGDSHLHRLESFLDMERGVCYLHRLGGITCLPLPEQAYIQLVTGPLPCQNTPSISVLVSYRHNQHTSNLGFIGSVVKGPSFSDIAIWCHLCARCLLAIHTAECMDLTSVLENSFIFFHIHSR